MNQERDQQKLRRWCIRRLLEDWSVREVSEHARTPKSTVHDLVDAVPEERMGGANRRLQNPARHPPPTPIHGEDSHRDQAKGRMVQRNHRGLPETARNPSQPQIHHHHHQKTRPPHPKLHPTQTTNLHPLPTSPPRQPMADGYQILRRPVPDRLPRRLQPLLDRPEPTPKRHNQQHPQPPRRDPTPRSYSNPDPQRPRNPILQQRRKESLHRILRGTWDRAYLRFHWKTHHAREDRTILANLHAILPKIRQPSPLQRSIQPQASQKP